MKKNCSPKSLLRNVWHAILRGLPFEASAVMVWSSLSRWQVVPLCFRVVLVPTKWVRQKFSLLNDFLNFLQRFYAQLDFFWQNILLEHLRSVLFRCQQDNLVYLCVRYVLSDSDDFIFHWPLQCAFLFQTCSFLDCTALQSFEVLRSFQNFKTLHRVIFLSM